MLFTLNDAAESMERESLDVGIVSVLEALDHARGPYATFSFLLARYSLDPASRIFPFSICLLYFDHHLLLVPYRSQLGEVSVPL